MKVAILLFVFISSGISCSTPAQEEQGITSQDSVALRHLKEVLWPRAYHTSDTALLNQILHEEFGLIDQSGRWYSKQNEIDYLKTNPSAPDSFYYEIKRLDLFENGTAIISGTGHILIDSSETIYQSSNVLIKNHGQWKVINSHVSGVEEKD